MVLHIIGQTSSRSLGSVHIFRKECHFIPTGRIQFLKIILSPPPSLNLVSALFTGYLRYDGLYKWKIHEDILERGMLTRCLYDKTLQLRILLLNSIVALFLCGFCLAYRYVHPRGGVIQSVSSWKRGSSSQYINTQQTQSWTAVTPQQNWSSPPEVVDLTLEEDTRRKYLL